MNKTTANRSKSRRPLGKKNVSPFGRFFLFNALVCILVLIPYSIVFSSQVALEVDCSLELGSIKFLAGVNNGPWTEDFTNDISEDYHDMGIDYIRTHDYYGPCDIHQIFPSWDADPDLPGSYDFAGSDAWVLAIVENGFIPYFRLGESFEYPSISGYNNPPPDFDKFADVCVHIVRHYNDGWANGFHFNIRYWEIWNEPDITIFWNGTPEQFYDLFDRTAKAIKAYDAGLMTGGPAITDGVTSEWLNGFFSYCKSNSTPLDFFSWHLYLHSPWDVLSYADKYQSLLDSYGFTSAESHFTEWNTRRLIDAKTVYNAAFTSAMFALMQDTTISLSTKYRGDDHVLGMFKNAERTPPVYSFMALKHMHAAPYRILATDSPEIAVLAGKSHEEPLVMILLSNPDSEKESYHLTVKNLPWEGPYVYQRYVINDSKNLEKAEEVNMEASSIFSTKENISSPEVHLICLREGTGAVWETAYDAMFDNRTDLLMFRMYRDKILSKTLKGEKHINLLYKNSEDALKILSENPELMLKAKHLVNTCKNALYAVLSGNEGVIHNTSEIISFLELYAKKSPRSLRLLANIVKEEMLAKQKKGKPFFGFRLK